MNLASQLVLYALIVWLLARSASLRGRVRALERALDVVRSEAAAERNALEAEVSALQGRIPEGMEPAPSAQPTLAQPTLARPTLAPKPAPAVTVGGVDRSMALARGPSTAIPPPPASPPSPVAKPQPKAPRAKPQPKAPRAQRISLEEWLGVRGAAVGAGIIAAVAAVMFFRHAVNQAWVSPTLRVGLSVAAGLLAVAIGHLPALRKFAITANALIGAGCVALYAASWSAHSLYSLIGHLPAGLLMAAVTALCCTLSLRRGSIQIALLALIGGFVTPLLLASGADKPVELFGYLLLLDGAFLYLANKRDWPVLAALSLVATLAFQVAWIGLKMGPERMWLGSGVLLIFGALYAATAQRTRSESPFARLWDVSTAAAVLLPFGFGLYFAAMSRLHVQPGPLITMLFVISAGTAWLRHRDPKLVLLQVAAASANVAVMAVFMFAGAPADLPLGLAVLSGLALLHHTTAELSNCDGEATTWMPAVAASLGGAFVVAVAAVSLPVTATLTWSCGVAGALFTLGLLRQASRQPTLAAGLALAGALSLSLTLTARLRDSIDLAGLWRHAGVVFGVGVAMHGWVAVTRDDRAKRWISHGAALFASVCLIGLVAVPSLGGATVLPVAWIIPGLATLLIATAVRRDAGGWQFTAVVLTIAAQQVHLAISHEGTLGVDRQTHELLLTIATVAALSWWPLVACGRFSRDPLAWLGSALAAPLGALPALLAWHELVGSDHDGALALIFAAISGLGFAAARRRWRRDEPFRSVGVGGFGSAALLFLTLAIPLQLSGWAWTIGWALEALLLVALWRRIDHAGLKYLAATLFAAVGIRLLLNPMVLDDYVRGSWRVFNGLALAYLVPVAALLLSGTWLRTLEQGRARRWEPWLKRSDLRLSTLLGTLAILLGFAWTNLAVLDWFAIGDTLTFSFERLPARDLSYSISWALYAMLLLAVGMRRQLVALRYLSLGLFVVTIGKVFLFDLGHLQDLYRVASLGGLAVSLFLVSLAYQRFVFRSPATP